MSFAEVNDFTGILISLIGVLATLAGFLFWRLLVRMETKLDELTQMGCHCRETLPERFMSRTELAREHEELWTALRNHDHNGRGRVVLGRASK